MIGTERFDVVRRLGSGGFGVVYEAHDRERNERVALKTLRTADASAIYRLKKEFRALADVVHPNLVSLYELFVREEDWFFTMELVEGIDLLRFTSSPELSVDRLLSAFRQVAEGVSAIHAAGKLHRDLKPSNVLVTPAGRAVVLDFGIVRERERPGGSLQTVEEGVLGTAAYMAPEQASGEATIASDWYAFGTMLYEALTGRLPYVGTSFAVLSSKHTSDAAPLGPLPSEVPTDVAILTMRLLARHAADRPGRAEILRALGALEQGGDSPSQNLPAKHILVGRAPQLAALDQGFAAAARGNSTFMYVHGPSGIGKTALVEHFLDRVDRSAHPLLLSGRCYVRESVPYRGFDGVIDHLSRYLRALPPDEIAQVAPPDLSALMHVFPVLARVETLSERSEPAAAAGDRIDLRRRAFTALRSLLGRIRSRRPVVIWIDDFQWGDPDTLALLDALMETPDPPALLFIATLRTDEVASRPFLESLLERPRSDRFWKVHIDPIDLATARELAREWLGPQTAARESSAEAIAREARGSPFLIEQLVRFVRAAADNAATSGVSLADMVDARIAQMPVGARALLETIATAGRPINGRVAAIAAEFGGDARPLLARLCAEHLVRVTGTVDQFDLYHDRLREALTAPLDAERRAGLHLNLARAMEAQGEDDPEALYEHFAAANRRADAAMYATRSAERAAGALAFERAADLYQRALDLVTGDAATADLTPLRVGLADALANAARSAEAGNAYLAAATSAHDELSFDLRRLAAEQFLNCGHVDRGLAVLDSVLEGVGLRLARSPQEALRRLLWRRALLKLRGLRFSECAAERVAPSVLRRIDVCWAVANSLARTDNIRAADFQSLNLLSALQAGEPYRVARALAVEQGFMSTAGQTVRRRAMQLEGLAHQLAHRIQHPHAIGMAELAAGVARFYFGNFAEAFRRCESAEEVFRTRCTGVASETKTAQTYALYALAYSGEWRELVRRVPVRLRDARERGDLYAAADLAAGRPNLAWLVADDVSGARAAFGDAMSRWSLQGFHFQHHVSLMALGQIDLYAGDGNAARRRLEAHWRDLTGSMLMRVQLLRIEGFHLRARGALAAASEMAHREDSLQSASRDARRIARERTTWAAPLADLVLAGVAAMRGDVDTALPLAERAMTAAEANGLAAFASAARRRYGELIGGAAGASCVERADAWMRSQGVVNVDRMHALLAPGFSP